MIPVNIQSIIQEINRELSPQFEEELRRHLIKKNKSWLIDQIVRLTLDKHSLEAWDRKEIRKKKDILRAQRIARLEKMQLDEPKLDAFIKQYEHFKRTELREYLESEEFLNPHPPKKGTYMIAPKNRSTKGEQLLMESKDILFALLYGDESTFVKLNRVDQELLTLTLPHFKANALDFMQATTEINSMGTWHDPHGVSHDEHADNMILQIEYGEVASKRISDGILTTLRLINNLEINEQILYARMINVEQSSLVH